MVMHLSLIFAKFNPSSLGMPEIISKAIIANQNAF